MYETLIGEYVVEYSEQIVVSQVCRHVFRGNTVLKKRPYGLFPTVLDKVLMQRIELDPSPEHPQEDHMVMSSRTIFSPSLT